MNMIIIIIVAILGGLFISLILMAVIKLHRNSQRLKKFRRLQVQRKIKYNSFYSPKVPPTKNHKNKPEFE